MVIWSCFTLQYIRAQMCSSTYLPMSRNSPTSPWRLMAIRMLRTVMPSQKQATTRALGRWARSRSSSRSKLCSPALLQILPGDNMSDKYKCGLWRMWYVGSVLFHVLRSVGFLWGFFFVRVALFHHALVSTIWHPQCEMGLHHVINNRLIFVVKYMSCCW